MSWRGFFLRGGINSDGSNIALERGNLTVQSEIIAAGVVPALIKPAVAAAVSYTIAQLLTGFVRRDPDGAARADLLPTAALIVAGIEGVFVGATFDFTISNEGSVTEIITVTTAAGLSLNGTMTIDGGDQRRFRAEVTNVTTPAVAIRSLGQSVEGLLATTAELNILDGVTADKDEINRIADVAGRIVTAVATLSVTKALHAERIVLLGVNSGFTSSLPAATGSGDKYTFIVSVAIASNDYKIAANGTDIIQGIALAGNDASPNMCQFWPTASDSDYINMDGSTQGGYIGDRIELVDIASGVWSIMAYLKQTGTEATPFGAT